LDVSQSVLSQYKYWINNEITINQLQKHLLM